MSAVSILQVQRIAPVGTNEHTIFVFAISKEGIQTCVGRNCFTIHPVLGFKGPILAEISSNNIGVGPVSVEGVYGVGEIGGGSPVPRLRSALAGDDVGQAAGGGSSRGAGARHRGIELPIAEHRAIGDVGRSVPGDSLRGLFHHQVHCRGCLQIVGHCGGSHGEVPGASTQDGTQGFRVCQGARGGAACHAGNRCIELRVADGFTIGNGGMIAPGEGLVDLVDGGGGITHCCQNIVFGIVTRDGNATGGPDCPRSGSCVGIGIGVFKLGAFNSQPYIIEFALRICQLIGTGGRDCRNGGGIVAAIIHGEAAGDGQRSDPGGVDHLHTGCGYFVVAGIQAVQQRPDGILIQGLGAHILVGELGLDPGDVHIVIAQQPVQLTVNDIGILGGIVVPISDHDDGGKLPGGNFGGPGQAGNQQVVADIGTLEGVALPFATDDFGAAITHIFRGEFGIFHGEDGHITREHGTDTGGSTGSVTIGLRSHHITLAGTLQGDGGGGVILFAVYLEVAMHLELRDRGVGGGLVVHGVVGCGCP